MSKPNSGHFKINTQGGGGGGGGAVDNNAIGSGGNGSDQNTVMSGAGAGVGIGLNGEGDNNKVPPLFDNGHVTEEGIRAHKEEFIGKSVEQIAELLKQNGYEPDVRPSKRIKKGSTAQIVEALNPSKDRNIRQVQVSPDGSKRHGGVPYVKISTTDGGIFKVIDATPDQYKTDEKEKAVLIFRRDEK